MSLLDRLEPQTPPSQRFNRIVWVESTRVLELRDPNSGQQGGPESKPRTQFILAGQRLWVRHLPPEAFKSGDSDVPWELAAAQGLPLEWAEKEALNNPVAVLKRLRLFSGSRQEFRIGSSYVPAHNDVDIVLGPITSTWYDVPLCPCPDCGGAVVWAEAGLVPGARQCAQCGSQFIVATCMKV